MANQITHIVLAEKAKEKLFAKFDRAEFLIGTTFPDIRYLRVIDRDATHFHNVTLNDVMNEQDSFTAGIKYHSLVDEKREVYIVEKDIYSLLPQSRYITQALKMYEDEVLYANVLDWDVVAGYFDTVLDAETSLVSEKDMIIRWHTNMQKYFKEIPADQSRKDFILGVGFSEEIAEEINELVLKMKEIPEVTEIILGMHSSF